MPSRIEGIATELVANFNARRFDAASKDFNADMLKVVTPAVMASIKQNLDSQIGEFLSVTRTVESQQDDVRIVDLLLRYGRGPISMRVKFDREDKVASVEFNQQAADPLEASARKFLSNFIAERYDEASADFAAAFRKELPPPVLRTLRSNTLAVYGQYDSIVEAVGRENEGFKIVDLKTRWGKSMVIISAVFDKDGHIAGLRMAPPQ